MITVTNVLLVTAALALMFLQSILVRLENPLWSALIPATLLTAALYAFFYLKIAVTYKSVLLFMFPFCWCLEECYRRMKGKKD